MNDFVAKYKNKMSGAKPRQQSKENKKGVTRALHESFKHAMDGKVAGINHNGIQYVMMKQTVFADIIKNGGKVLLTEEQQEFNRDHQVLLNMMQSLNIEDLDEQMLFGEIDQFSFLFAQHISDPKGAKKRREITKEFKEVIASSELLTKMEKNLRKQLFGGEEEEVENNGKLT